MKCEWQRASAAKVPALRCHGTTMPMEQSTDHATQLSFSVEVTRRQALLVHISFHSTAHSKCEALGCSWGIIASGLLASTCALIVFQLPAYQYDSDTRDMRNV